ncbi:MAG: hypothetical protein JWP12_3530 [Bacteroidetes bacterium]|nr:hypothetical protein [Bacteroidota bacterium]
METKDKTISLLNELIKINNDRIEGYEKAAKETTEQEFKSIFGNMAQESQKYKNELIAEVTGLGGAPAEGTTTSGKVYRAWMDIKAALSGKDRKAILASCEFGEDAALEAYRDVLKSDEFAKRSREVVILQQNNLQNSHDKIKLLRDNVKVL